MTLNKGHKELLKEGPLNPFALASWLHLVLVKCHPFDVRGLQWFLLMLHPDPNLHV